VFLRLSSLVGFVLLQKTSQREGDIKKRERDDGDAVVNEKSIEKLLGGHQEQEKRETSS
jgi:hypothetical protein